MSEFLRPLILFGCAVVTCVSSSRNWIYSLREILKLFENQFIKSRVEMRWCEIIVNFRRSLS